MQTCYSDLTGKKETCYSCILKNNSTYYYKFNCLLHDLSTKLQCAEQTFISNWLVSSPFTTIKTMMRKFVKLPCLVTFFSKLPFNDLSVHADATTKKPQAEMGSKCNENVSRNNSECYLMNYKKDQ
jgi:hypothetical protein